MKCKKYIAFMLLILFWGCHNILAAEGFYDCYYISSNNDFKASIHFDYTENNGMIYYSDHQVYIDFNGAKNDHNKEDILNLNSSKTVHGVKVEKLSTDFVSSKSCPKYVIFQRDEFLINSYSVWATNDASTAKLTAQAIDNAYKKSGYYATYTNSGGSAITSDQYYGKNNTGTNVDGIDVNVNCESLFDSKTGEYSIRELINEVMQYPRIIVPIMIIVLGILDLSKAVIASKEDEMKKAQSKFIKRVIIGVAVFFVPLFVNVIMDLADIVWEGLGYTTCDF